MILEEEHTHTMCSELKTATTTTTTPAHRHIFNNSGDPKSGNPR
jgi:hypothetical protein